MKIFFSFLLSLFLFSFATSNLFAQYRKLTVVLLRHAEKDVSEDADSANPDLSAAGKERAEKLPDVINKYQPDAIFSTDTIRTRATVRPLARKINRITLIYDERNLSRISDLILSGKYKRIVVVGHYDSTPALANLLIKQDKYKPLGEAEFDKIWIIKIRRYKRKPNKVRDKVIQY
ncbi:MAG: histidine phosphatase family protein [Acidobacteriota bacterium]|nr:histidine phosphatase family protein [Acidobacteriota bacterium]